MLDLARASRATTAVTLMASASASRLDALGKGSATKITLALTDKTVLAATGTGVSGRTEELDCLERHRCRRLRAAGLCVWRRDGQVAGTVQNAGYLYSIRPLATAFTPLSR